MAARSPQAFRNFSTIADIDVFPRKTAFPQVLSHRLSTYFHTGSVLAMGRKFGKGSTEDSSKKAAFPG
jgi:hypothetical protein